VKISSIQKRFMVLTLLVFGVVVVCLIGSNAYLLNNSMNREVVRFKREEYEKVRATLKERVERMADILGAQYRLVSQTQSNDTARYNEMLRFIDSHIVDLRYDNGAGYIWINDMSYPYPRMIRHPTLPQLNNHVLDDPGFNTFGKKNQNVFVAMREICQSQDEGFLEYFWPKPSGDTLIDRVPKISYVTIFKPLNWIVGSGIYVDDIEKAVAERERDLHALIRKISLQEGIISTILLILAIGLIIRASGEITRPVIALSDAIKEIRTSDGTSMKPIILNRNDEIGTLADGFNNMLLSISKSMEHLKRANKQLSQSNQALEEKRVQLLDREWYYRRIIESFHDIYFQTDLQGNITLCSPSFKIQLGYEPDYIIGRPVADLCLEASDAEKLALELEHTGEAKGEAVPIVHKNGATLFFEINMYTSFDREGSAFGFEGVARNITERVEAQQKEEMNYHLLLQADKLKSIGRLTSGITHEINNPVNFIRLAGENLEDTWQSFEPALIKNKQDIKTGAVDPDMLIRSVPRFYSAIYEGCDRITHVIDGLRKFSRPNPTNEYVSVQMNEVIESAYTITAHTIKKATHHFTMELDGNLPCVAGNFQQLEQVVINLILNACQALDSSDKAISIVTRMDEKNAAVLVEVRDTGEGISLEHQPLVFDPFFTTKRDIGGTGIGLSISYSIMKEHQGTIVLQSQRGEGSTFSISIPAKKS